MGNRSLTGTTRVVAVWGHPVSHSRSPVMQNAALAALGLDWIYVPFDIDPANLRDAVTGLRGMNFIGANCTVPLKESILPLLDSFSSEAGHIGSVNTIVNRDGKLAGYSTDGAGLYWDLQRRGVLADGKKILIWGAGGSARAVAYTLAQHGCRITIANRTLRRAIDVANLVSGRFTELAGVQYEEALKNADILINTTTLGMLDNVEMPPISEGLLNSGQVVYDLVYSPKPTPLLDHGNQVGCKTFNGLGMLVCQGALSLSLWTGLPAEEMPLDVMDAAVRYA